MSEPVKGKAFQFVIGLEDVNDPQKLLVDPTIVAGDFKISKDGNPYVNLQNIPGTSPGGSSAVLISLTGGEMNADRVLVSGVQNAANQDWADILIEVPTPTGSGESVFDILVGDVVETAGNTITRRKGTVEILVNKNIQGSQLDSSLTISTTEA